MKPRRGAAQPSPMTCSQLVSVSVSGTLGSRAASASLAGSCSCGTMSDTESPPSGGCSPCDAGGPVSDPREESAATSLSTHAGTGISEFLRVSSGESGGSYGASTPVKFLMRPCATFLYSPFGSRALTTSSGTSMNTSRKGRPRLWCIARAASRSLRYGEMRVTIVMTPASLKSAATSAARRTDSPRSAAEKPRSRVRPVRKLSPSIR
mmetsp:Transcript_6970/g.16233  ORF Transcript_6970/g.16233 Transcript_6970/m.16233 type:complete len:208 (-) Transcript_6970:440-1063(-)